jgi:hypothetical protein
LPAKAALPTATAGKLTAPYSTVAAQAMQLHQQKQQQQQQQLSQQQPLNPWLCHSHSTYQDPVAFSIFLFLWNIAFKK